MGQAQKEFTRGQVMRSFFRLKFLYQGFLFFAIAGFIPVGAEEFVIVVSNVTLCKTPTENCVPNSYKTSDWPGCKLERSGCYVRKFDMKLPAGEVVQTISPDGNGNPENWIRVKARQCVPVKQDQPMCKETFTGWLRKSQVAYIDEFKPIASWPMEQAFQMEVGDWLARINIRRDGTFSYSDNNDECKTEQCSGGAIYTHRNLVWARFGNRSDLGFLFIKLAGQETYCWTNAPDRGFNCFLSPFHSPFPRLPEDAEKTEAFLKEKIPLGTSFVRVRSRMKRLGFDCTEYDGGSVDKSDAPAQICEKALIASGVKQEWIAILRPWTGRLDSVEVQYLRTNR
jgi:hypothetical protein